MKLLAFSDIHNNMNAVRKLRLQEANDYEGILVAGDIGSESIAELQSILCSFRCPVLFVYGNWDNEAEYDAPRLPGFHLVHHNIVQLGEYAITGFSGCPHIGAAIQLRSKRMRGCDRGTHRCSSTSLNFGHVSKPKSQK